MHRAPGRLPASGLGWAWLCRVVLVVLACVLPCVAGAVEVAYEGKRVVFYWPEDGVPTGILVWFHAADDNAGVAAGWFRGRGFTDRGLAIAAPPNRIRWNDETDALFAVGLIRELQQRLHLDSAATIIGGEGDGAAFAMHLGTTYQSAVCSAVLLARGGASGRWNEAAGTPPLFGVYANANDRLVQISSMRTVERRLKKSGYSVRFASGLVDTAWGDPLAGLLETLCTERGIALGPPVERPEVPLVIPEGDE